MIRVRLNPQKRVLSTVIEKVSGGWSVSVRQLAPIEKHMSTRVFSSSADANAYRDRMLA